MNGKQELEAALYVKGVELTNNCDFDRLKTVVEIISDLHQIDEPENALDPIAGVISATKPKATEVNKEYGVDLDIRAKQLLLTISRDDSDREVMEKEFVSVLEAAAFQDDLSKNAGRQIRRDCNSGKLLGKKNKNEWEVSSVSLVLFKHGIQDPRLVDDSE